MNLPPIFKKNKKPQILVIKKGSMRPEQMKELGEKAGVTVIEAEDINDFKFVGNEPEVIGDGNATFIEPMSESEYAKWRHEEEHGWRGVYNKLLKRN